MSGAEMKIVDEPGDKWFIWCKKGRAPRFAHPDEESARIEAMRLAAAKPGAKFHIMKSVAKISAAPVECGEKDAATMEDGTVV